MSWKMKYEESWGQLGIKSDVKKAFKDPLHPLDTESQTLAVGQIILIFVKIICWIRYVRFVGKIIFV